MTCRCHDEPMRWHRDKRRQTGGYWECMVKRRASWKRYHRSNTWEDNQRRMFIGNTYIGRFGFTQAEREEMIRGKTH